ncbi:YchJ family protein [Rhodopseudomonas palustris]|uniref:SecC-like protein n=1 Tax=Rhodopseudomonas palustris (strain BisB18) TaxID=316056 RepID=Q20XR3_RHOPB
MKCLCCADKPFDQCCGPLLAGTTPAATPEALMRSRYAAYVRKDFDYILNSTDPQVRDELDHDANRAWMDGSTFTGLDILSSSQQGSRGEVEFIAWFRQGTGPEQKHHERSEFRKHRGRWFFREGRMVANRA